MKLVHWTLDLHQMSCEAGYLDLARSEGTLGQAPLFRLVEFANVMLVWPTPRQHKK